jgi:hypothetical protein
MKALIINRDLSVAEHEGERDSWMDQETDWDAVDLNDQNVIYFDDNAMEDADVIFARVSQHPKIPLPAYVVGKDGEKTGEPTISATELEAHIS